MTATAAFPWTLRLELEGAASLRVERRGRTLRFDPLPPAPPGEALGETPPWRPITAEDIVVLTDTAPERLAGAVAAVRAGLRPTVVATPELLVWLSKQGELVAASDAVDGVSIELLPYAPAPRPATLRRLWAGVRGPKAPPVAVGLTLEGGRRLVHLNLALHARTPAPWLESALARFRGADWLVVGVPPDAVDLLPTLLPRFEARRVLVADLTGDGRRAQAVPETPLTPLVDRLVADGLEAYVFATRSSLRFE